MPYCKQHRDIRGSMGMSFPVFNMRLSRSGSDLVLTYTKKGSPPSRPCRIPILTEGRKLAVRTSTAGEKEALVVTHAHTGMEHVFLFNGKRNLKGANMFESTGSATSKPAAWVTRIVDAFESNGAATRLGQHITAGYREARFKICGKQIVAQVPECCHDLKVTAKPAAYSLGRLRTPPSLNIHGHNLHLTLHVATAEAAVSPKNIADARAKFKKEFSAYSSLQDVNFQQMDLLSCDEGCGYALLADCQDPFDAKNRIFSGISGRFITFVRGSSAYFVVDFMHSVLDRDMATAEARKNALVFACSLRAGSGTRRFRTENEIDPLPQAIGEAGAVDYSTSTSTESSTEDDEGSDNTREIWSDDEATVSQSKTSVSELPPLAGHRPRSPPPPPPPTLNTSLVLKIKAIGASAEKAVSGFNVKMIRDGAMSTALCKERPACAPPPPPVAKAAQTATFLKARPMLAPPAPPATTRHTEVLQPQATAVSIASDPGDDNAAFVSLMARFENLNGEATRPTMAPPPPPQPTVVSSASKCVEAHIHSEEEKEEDDLTRRLESLLPEWRKLV